MRPESGRADLPRSSSLPRAAFWVVRLLEQLTGSFRIATSVSSSRIGALAAVNSRLLLGACHAGHLLGINVSPLTTS